MKKITLLIILSCLPKVMAQHATVTSGGNSIGTGGKVSYSIGQVVNKSQSGTTGTVTQGVQQPFEILTLSGEEFSTITLEAFAYPNPTTSFVNLTIKNYPLENLNYQLLDINGRIIEENKVLDQETTINLELFASSIYILKLNSINKEIKTFKIIKN